MYTYSPAEWVLIFYCYCFLGWCFETAVVSFQQRRFVNRGFVRGPVLPLYGTGAVLLLYIALPLRDRPVLMFFAGMLAATILEYVTGWAMESLFKIKYWDYSEHKFQYQGRICLQSSVAWGVLSILLVWVIQPPIARGVALLPPFAAGILALTISVIFVADVSYAFRTALDLARVLEELTRLREQMGQLRGELGALASETRERLSETVQETREKLADATIEAAARHGAVIEERRAHLQQKLEELARSYEKRVSGIGRTRRWLVRGNPGAVSEKFGEALAELKEKFNR